MKLSPYSQQLTPLEQRAQDFLDARRRLGFRIEELTMSTPSVVADFVSNDYLSLSTLPELRSSFLSRLVTLTDPVGGRGSRYIDGNSTLYVALERRIAAYFYVPAALIFASGYDANLAIFSCLPGPDDIVVYDSDIHASARDGLRLSSAQKLAFSHNSLEDLRAVLERVARETGIKTRKNSVFVAVETIYSMEGDFCPLREVADLMDSVLPPGTGQLLVDEAHSSGIYDEGTRLVSALRMQNRVASTLCTFGKSFAANGAAVLSSVLIRTLLTNSARSLVFTTAMSPAALVAIECALDLQSTPLLKQLRDSFPVIVTYIWSELETLITSRQIPKTIAALLPTPYRTYSGYVSPVIPLLCSKSQALAAYLNQNGYNFVGLIHPSVPKGRERIRITVHARNTRAEIDRLVSKIGDWCALEISQAPTQSRLLAARDASAKL